MRKRLKNIRLRPLLSHLIITMGYPVVRALLAEEKRLLLFTDALTIVGMMLLAGGVFYSMYIHGDYDVTGFVLKRGRRGENQTFSAYMADRKEKRADAFNYPLFLGIVYLALSAVIACVFL